MRITTQTNKMCGSLILVYSSETIKKRYSQSYNIGLVMHLLNHSSEAMTLTYLGLDQASRETMLDQIDFG